MVSTGLGSLSRRARYLMPTALVACCLPVLLLRGAPAGAAPAVDGGYWLVALDGGVFTFGDAGYYGSLVGVVSGTGGTKTVALAPDPHGGGYWLASANGAVAAFGDAPSFSSAAGLPLSAPVVGLAATPDGGGYWEVAADGGVFSYGDAHFYGSMGSERLNALVGGIASS